MCEVVKTNFEDKFGEIVGNIKDASFIGVDCEFSGILADEAFKNSLFDTPSERYAKQRQSVEKFMVIQMGISTFKYNRHDNGYLASSYTFYLFPKAFGTINPKFTCEVSSLEFLCHHNFDFNKWFHEGIGFVNRTENAMIKEQIKSGFMFQAVDRNLSFNEEDIVQNYCSRVAEWAASSKGDETFLLNVQSDGIVICYIVHQEIRKRFPSLWTFQKDKCVISVEKVSAVRRSELQADVSEANTLHTSVHDSLIGFSKVFEVLVSAKKPIIGHNIWMDLLMLYKQFISPLPKSYNSYKTSISQIFPVVFDTKHMSFNLREKIKKDEVWSSNSLGKLCKYFTEGRGTHLALHKPSVTLLNGPFKRQDMFHEAGYDSYCAGVCFIGLAHLFRAWDSDKKEFAHHFLPATATEHLAAVSAMKNKVNIIRASVNSICLDGRDPDNQRPPLLHVEAKGFRVINVYKLAGIVGRFGVVDIKQCTRRRALIAAGNHNSARDIYQHLAKHGEWRVSRYSSLRHSSAARIAMWCCCLASTAACALAVLQHIK